MPDFISGNPQTWYENKWPYASPAQVRHNAKHVDTMGRSYCPVSKADARFMELSRSKTWWWVALKNVDQPHPDRFVTREGARFRVTGIGLDFYPRRVVGVISVSR